MIKTKRFLLGLGLALFGNHFEANAKQKDAFSFLLLSPAARAAAMGEAYASVAEGPEAIFYNPAGLSQTEDTHLYGQSFIPPFLEGVKYSNFALVRPISNGAWGFHTGVLHVGGFTQTVADPSIPDGYRETGGFSTYDLRLTGSLGRRVGKTFAIGTNVSFLRESLSDESANAYAVDFGMLLVDPIYPLRFGAAIQNFGPKVKFKDESYSIPALLRAGLALYQRKNARSLRMVPSGSQVTAEILKPFHDDHSFLGGLEIPIKEKFFLRAGYQYHLTKQDLASKLRLPNGFSAGMGFSWSRFHFSYALSSLGELGLIHRLAIDLAWIKPPSYVFGPESE